MGAMGGVGSTLTSQSQRGNFLLGNDGLGNIVGRYASECESRARAKAGAGTHGEN